MDLKKAKAAIAALNLSEACTKELNATLDRHAKKAGKAAAKAASTAAVAATSQKLLEACTTICTALNAPIQLATAGQRIGLSNRIPSERSLLLKAMRKLEANGQMVQVGWQSGKVKPVHAVNNFQRRWMPAGMELS